MNQCMGVSITPVGLESPPCERVGAASTGIFLGEKYSEREVISGGPRKKTDRGAHV
jgi:hypothetical protein